MATYKWGKFEKKLAKKYRLIREKTLNIGRKDFLGGYESYTFDEDTGEVGYTGQFGLLRRFYHIPYEDYHKDQGYVIIEYDLTNVRDKYINHDNIVKGTTYGHKKESYYIDVKGSRVDTVKSTNRNAYPNNGASGDYWYVYEGIANQEPSISGKDEDLGGFKAPFKKVFSVNDPDNNETLNVTVKLNSATIRTINNATKGESYEIDIDKAKFDELELNKSNTIEITVSDSNGASAIRRYIFKKVNTNPVVTVTNSNLGEQNKPFNFSFKAADPDGDDITVKVYVDDVQLQDLGKVTPNQSKTVSIGKLDYAKLLNGEHRIKIEATDSFGAKGTGYITFTKKITHCWYNLKKEVDAQPSAVVVNPLTELAKGAKMTVKVSLNAKDTKPTWEVMPEELIGQKYNFKTKTKTADKWCIGVDIRIDRADTPEGMESYFYGFVGAYM
ncbi:MAG: hypothetical protein E6987_00250 [Peptoniphilus harei]|nr:hypothetical protein [Peptoniphilus harei]